MRALRAARRAGAPSVSRMQMKEQRQIAGAHQDEKAPPDRQRIGPDEPVEPHHLTCRPLSNLYLHVMVRSQNGNRYGAVAAARSFGLAVTCR